MKRAVVFGLWIMVSLMLIPAAGNCGPFDKYKPPVTGGPGTTTKAMEDHVAAENKCPSLAKLDQDTARLDGDVTMLAARLQTLSNRLNQIAILLAIPSNLAADLKKIEGFMITTQKGAKLAEGVPQFQQNAKKVDDAITPALAQVRTARTKADALAARLEPARKASAKMSDYSGKSAKALNAFSADILKHEPDAGFGAQVSIVHYDEPTRSCIQGKVDDLAGRLDKLVTEMDKVTKLLLTDLSINSPAISGLEDYAAKLNALDGVRKKAELLEDRLDAMCKGLDKLEELMDDNFTVSIPYLVGSYKVHVGMSTILKGSKAIEDYIKDAVSDAVWEAAKTFGVGKLVDEVVSDASHAIDKVGNQLHLNPDMSIPGLEQLDGLTAQADQLVAIFSGGLKIPDVNVDSPDFGLPQVPAGLDLRNISVFLKQLSPYGFGWDWARLEANVPAFGCN